MCPVVQGPFMSVDARGSAFGMTASSVRGGHIMKKKARPSTKYEPRQNQARAILGYLSRQWGGLENAARDSWDEWALDHPGTDKFGDPFIMSGFNAFIMLNHHTVRFNHGTDMNVLPPEDPPASSAETVDVVTGSVAAGDIDVRWTELGVGLPADVWEIQIAGPFQSPGRKSVASRFHFGGSVVGTADEFTIGGLDVGMWYWVRVRYVAFDGQVTAWVSGQATPYAGGV